MRDQDRPVSESEEFKKGTPRALSETSEPKSETRLQSLFEKLDLNKDGKIDSEELAEGLHNMGYVHIR